MTLLLGVLYLKCEDTKSVISTLISGSSWSTVGLFHSTDEKSTLEAGTKYYLFDIADASRPQFFNVDCTLLSLKEHPLVSRIGKQSYIVEKKVHELFIVALMREVSMGTNNGATIVSRVLAECQLDHKQDINEIALPEKRLVDFLQSRTQADDYYKKNIISSASPEIVLLRLMACHDYLTRFLPFDNSEVKRVLNIMNDYRHYLDLPLLLRLPKTDAIKDGTRLSNKNGEELKDLLHYLNSLNDPALRDLENMIMRELASRDKK